MIHLAQSIRDSHLSQGDNHEFTRADKIHCCAFESASADDTLPECANSQLGVILSVAFACFFRLASFASRADAQSKERYARQDFLLVELAFSVQTVFPGIKNRLQPTTAFCFQPRVCRP